MKFNIDLFIKISALNYLDFEMHLSDNIRTALPCGILIWKVHVFCQPYVVKNIQEVYKKQSLKHIVF